VTVVAGVDSSTQSCTVALFDAATGRRLGQASSPHSRVTPPNSEQHPDQWWVAFSRALAAASADAGYDPWVVEAISIAGQCHGLVALDGEQQVIRPAKLWNDTSSAKQARSLVEALGPLQWAERTGSVPTAAFTITKLAWMRDEEPENFRRIRHIMMPHDWLSWRLSGRLVTDRSEASGTGYFDVRTGAWAPDLLELVDPGIPWRETLPTVGRPFDRAGQLTDQAAGETGLRPGALVAAGAGDQHAAALALQVRPSDLLISLGTSGVVMTKSEQPCVDVTGLVNGVCAVDDGFLPLACTQNATQVTDTMAAWLGVSHAELAALALAEPVGASDRPVLVPFLGGERTPDLPLARGLFGGLDGNTTRGGLARAAFEGVLLGLLEGALALAALGMDIGGRLLVTGGGSRSVAYVQLLADLSGREVTVLDVPDATVRGAALQAAAALGGERFDQLAAAWAVPKPLCVTPRAGADGSVATARYREMVSWPGHRRQWRETA
jgi:xylulokinase